MKASKQANKHASWGSKHATKKGVHPQREYCLDISVLDCVVYVSPPGSGLVSHYTLYCVHPPSPSTDFCTL